WITGGGMLGGRPALFADRDQDLTLAYSGQLVVALAKPLQAHREADALFRGLEDDEGRGGAGAQLADQLVVHDDFRDTAVRQAAHKTGAADIDVVDLQAKPGRQQ